MTTLQDANRRVMQQMATKNPAEFYYRTRGISEQQAREWGLDINELRRLPHPADLRSETK